MHYHQFLIPRLDLYQYLGRNLKPSNGQIHRNIKKEVIGTSKEVVPHASTESKPSDNSQVKMKPEQSSGQDEEVPVNNRNLEWESDSESFDQNSLQSINEEDDSKAESASPRHKMKKRSITNLRFEFQPNILIEADTNIKDQDFKSSSSVVNGDRDIAESPKKNYLNIDGGRMKKQ